MLLCVEQFGEKIKIPNALLSQIKKASMIKVSPKIEDFWLKQDIQEINRPIQLL